MSKLCIKFIRQVFSEKNMCFVWDFKIIEAGMDFFIAYVEFIFGLSFWNKSSNVNLVIDVLIFFHEWKL